MKSDVKNGRGGSRKGAGRKKSGRKAFCISMRPATMRQIAAKAAPLTPGQFLDREFGQITP